MLRRLLSLVALCCISTSFGQDYTETWRDITTGQNASEKIVWRKVRCAANDDVVVAGTASDATLSQLIVKRYDSSGNERWTTRDLTANADQLAVLEMQVDAAGNVYSFQHDLAQHRLSLVSFDSTTGAVRWRRFYDVHPEAVTAGFPQGFIVVGTRGTSTFVYVAVNDRIGPGSTDSRLRLERLSPTTGATTQSNEFADTVDTFASTGTLDNTGNLVLGVLRRDEANIEKFTQGLAPVWKHTLTNLSEQIFVASHPVTQEVLGVSTFFGATRFALVDRVSGTPIRSGDFLDVRDSGVLAGLEPFSTGAWYAAGAKRPDGRITVGISRDFQEFATKVFDGTSAEVVDPSGTLHYIDQFLSFRVRNFPRGSTFQPITESGSSALGIAADSQDRVLMVGATNANSAGAVVQLTQPFVVTTDVFTRPFVARLDVLAPGVLGNDLHTKGATISVGTPPSKGTVTLNADGSFSYVPGGSFDGNDQFQYRLTKGNVIRTATCFVKRLRITEFTLDRSTVVGEDGFRGKMILSSASFVNDFFVPVTSDDPAARLLPQIFQPTVASAQLSGSTFAVTSSHLVTLTASLSGETLTRSITVTPGGFDKVESVANAPIIAGQISQFRLLLTGPAPADRIYPLSSNPPIAGLPASVSVPVGATFASFSVPVPTDQQFITLTVHAGFFFGRVFAVKQRPVLTNLELLTEPLYAGVSASVRATLDSPSGSTPNIVTLASNLPSANVPASLSVATNQTIGSAGFTSELSAANLTLTVTGTLGTTSISDTALIRPNLLDRFAISPNNVPTGGAVTGTVDLNWVAPAKGQVVTIKTTTPSLVTVPSSIIIPAGQTTKSFPIVARAPGTAKVTVTIGKKSITKGLTVTP